MQIVEKNEGTKIDYNLRGTKLSFADGEITLNLARYQRDDEVTKDIMVDADGYLTTGKGLEREVVNRTPKPLDTDKVTLYLFSIDGITIN